MNTLQKRKMAMKMLTKQERANKKPVFDSIAWRARRDAIQKRIRENHYKIVARKKLREYEAKKAAKKAK